MFDKTNNKEQIYILSHRHSERFQFLENMIAVGEFKKFRCCYVGNDKGGKKKEKFTVSWKANICKFVLSSCETSAVPRMICVNLLHIRI